MRGVDKMLEPVDGQPLIRRQAMAALATGQPVWVALPVRSPLRRAAIAGLAVTDVPVDAAERGISRSIIAGNAAIPAQFGLLLWLADLPDIGTVDLLRMVSAAQSAPKSIIRATTQDGKPGHPVYFPSALRPVLAHLAGDSGARDVLQDLVAQTVMVPLPGNRALTDLDTPEDWSDWRASRNGSSPSGDT